MQNFDLFVATSAVRVGAQDCKLQVSPLRQTITPFGFGRDDRSWVDWRSEGSLRAEMVMGGAISGAVVRV